MLDLAMTAGEMRRMDDEMHFPPAVKGDHGWKEVGGRSKSSVPLVRSLRRVDDDDTDESQGYIKGRDIKLWSKQASCPFDRLSACLKWSVGQKRRELDKNVKRGLRQVTFVKVCMHFCLTFFFFFQLPLGVLTEGPHALRLDCAVNLNRLFNERFSFGNMSPMAFNKLLLAAGIALTQEDSHSVTITALRISFCPSLFLSTFSSFEGFLLSPNLQDSWVKDYPKLLWLPFYLGVTKKSNPLRTT